MTILNSGTLSFSNVIATFEKTADYFVVFLIEIKLIKIVFLSNVNAEILV